MRLSIVSIKFGSFKVYFSLILLAFLCYQNHHAFSSSPEYNNILEIQCDSVLVHYQPLIPKKPENKRKVGKRQIRLDASKIEDISSNSIYLNAHNKLMFFICCAPIGELNAGLNFSCTKQDHFVKLKSRAPPVYPNTLQKV